METQESISVSFPEGREDEKKITAEELQKKWSEVTYMLKRLVKEESSAYERKDTRVVSYLVELIEKLRNESADIYRELGTLFNPEKGK